MIQVILWDIDGTLLDFGLAEKAAIRACFIRFGLGECPDDMPVSYTHLSSTSAHTWSMESPLQE